jgi:hypothetical protein
MNRKETEGHKDIELVLALPRRLSGDTPDPRGSRGLLPIPGGGTIGRPADPRPGAGQR